MDIVFLGNYTQDLIVKEVEKTWNQNDLRVHLSGFNQYQQEILNNESPLYNTQPDVVFLSLDFYLLMEDIIYLRDIPERIKESMVNRLEETIRLYKTLSENLPNTQIFIDNFYVFRPVLMTTLEHNTYVSISEFLNLANYRIVSELKALNNAKVIDVMSLVISKGAMHLFDERMHYIAKSHWSLSGLQHISNLYSRYLNAFIGRRKKCLVLDLDNTLWGGIIGDDGIDNIGLSNDGPNKAFYDFQREILKLHERGILLAICSKNSEDIALEAIENHPHMLLKKEHFLSIRINWNNKAQNIQEIASEINIGLDSLVFIDDSPFEREVVSSKLPDVMVPELPTEFSEYPNFIRNLKVFDFLTLSDDDFSRNDIYKANINREKLKIDAINIEDFYYSLEMELIIGEITESQIVRISQMTLKTNQFNLRTKRYNESDVKRFNQSSEHRVYQLTLKDKFGDNGIVGCAIVNITYPNAFIDTFILSCRVMGRTVETALLNYIIDDVKKSGCNELVGEYIPTKKNAPCSNFYLNHSFLEKNKGRFSIEPKIYIKKELPWVKVK
jgi:FkbH-like protein